MPKMLKSVRVTFLHGEELRAQVESWSVPGEHHMVDLSSYQPLGECSCTDFSCRRLPEFKKTGKPVRCRHIVAVREAYLNRLIQATSTQLAGDGE